MQAQHAAVPVDALPPELLKVVEAAVHLYVQTNGADTAKRVVGQQYDKTARYESPLVLLLGRSSIATAARIARILSGRVEVSVKPVRLSYSDDQRYFALTIPMTQRWWPRDWLLPLLRMFGRPEYTRMVVVCTLLLDSETGKVVLHKDSWEGRWLRLPTWCKTIIGAWVLPCSSLLGL